MKTEKVVKENISLEHTTVDVKDRRKI